MQLGTTQKTVVYVLVTGCAFIAAASCGSSGGSPTPATGAPDSGPSVISDPSTPPPAQPGTLDPNPTSPPDDSGNPLGWPPAPQMGNVQVQPNRDSAIVYLPDVPGVKDYRVMFLPAGMTVTTDGNGGETVKGTTIFCAGYRQHAAPAGPRELLKMVEAYGFSTDTRVVIEAIDAPCPFPGIRGSTHHDFTAPQQDVAQQDRVPFAIFTDQEITAKYGSLIINGHGAPAVLAGQAAPITPKVLARTAIKISPLGYAAQAPASTFFDDFNDPNDQPKYVKDLPDYQRTQYGKLSQNSKWSFFTYDAKSGDPEGDSQVYIERGQLRMVIGDWAQDVMSTNLAIAKRPAQLSATDYLHLTYEVQNDATGRRYWWLSLCGAPDAGKTIDASGNYLGNLIQTASFMENDGLNPSVEGWNCLQIFPRNGWPVTMPPDNKNPETEVRVMLNKPGNIGRSNVVNTDPSFMPIDNGPPSWFRQIDAKGQPVAPMLDDQQLVAPRTRFDVYVRRDRVIMLVNGQQRICNDFTKNPLTMAEAAVGLGQVFYHSSAERTELPVDYWVETGKYYILEDSPYLDVRTYDNVGYTEHAAAPDKFDESVCFKYAP